MIHLRTEHLLAGVGVATATVGWTVYMTRTVLKECIELLNSQLVFVRNIGFLLSYMYIFFFKANISKLILFSLLLN